MVEGKKRSITSTSKLKIKNLTASSKSYCLISRRKSEQEDFTINSLRFSSIGLHGRKIELIQQREAFDRVCGHTPTEENSSNGRELILISGKSGTGKTSLALELEGPTIKCGGFFVSGKFDIQRITEPYTAFLMVFTNLCDKIFNLKRYNESEKIFGKMKIAIDKAVGSEGKTLLTSVIPNLNLVLHDDDDSHTKDKEDYKDEFDDKSSSSCIYRRSLNNLKTLNGPAFKHKFYYILRRFVRAICSDRSQPLVILLDDLQWADSASLELLEHLLTDRLNSGLLVVGCYRDNDIGTEGHSFAAWLRGVEQLDFNEPKQDDVGEFKCGSKINTGTNIKITNIPISNLSVDAVHELLEDLLNSNKTDTAALASIVHRRTQGNTFFVIEFLKSLKDTGLIKFNMGLMKWSWDEQTIRSSTNVTDNVAGLVKEKMKKKLGEDEKEILLIGACLGFTFEVYTLMLIVSEMHKNAGEEPHRIVLSTHRSIGICVDEGMLECGVGTCGAENGHEGLDSLVSAYRFVHDQVYHAALSLISEDELNLLRSRVGEVLMTHMSEEAFEKNLFVAVNLLNKRIGLSKKSELTNGEKGGMHKTKIITQQHVTNIDLVQLNLRAGKKAMESSAFALGSVYLRTGIDLLKSEDKWCEEGDDKDISTLTINLFSAAAQVEYCIGNFELMHEYLNVVLSRDAVPIEDKFDAYSTLLEGLRAQEKFEEGTEQSLNILSKIGVKFPKNRYCLKTSVVKTFISTTIFMKGKSMEKLSNLPLMQDEKKIMAMKVMDGLTTFAYFVGESDLITLVILKMLRWCVWYGISLYAPPSFLIYGLILCTLQDFKGGNEYGNLAISLTEKFDAKEVMSRVVVLYRFSICHWIVPLHACSGPHLEGYQIGMETGDLENAMWNISGYMWCSLNSGRSLVAVEKEIRNYVAEIKQYKQYPALTGSVVLWQFALCLMGQAEDPSLLTGEAMNFDDFVAHLKAKKNSGTMDSTRIIRLMLAYYFDKYEMAWQLVEEAYNFENSNRSHVFLWRKMMFQGLTAFALARTSKKSRMWRVRALRTEKRMRKWISLGNVNCVHVVHLLQAEEAALSGQKDKAWKKYNASIITSGRAGFIHDKALANERAGEFSLSLGNENLATFHLRAAYQIYTDWGAKGKADHILKKHPKLLDNDANNESPPQSVV